MDKGHFREDLFHRLSVMTLNVPSINERNEDKMLLLDFFKQQFVTQMGQFTFDEEAKQLWNNYDFPGNVRELRNIAIRLSVKFPGQTVKAPVLKKELMRRKLDSGLINETSLFLQNLNRVGFQLNGEIKRIEKAYIELALEESKNNMSHAASLLGINRSTLYGRIDRTEEESQ
jgi:DNA-binding NtrC family response regulator